MQSHGTPGTTRRCRPNQSTRRVPPTCKSVQQTKISTITKENSVGPRNWTTTECPEITSRKIAKTSARWNQGNRKIYGRTPTTRNNQSWQRTLHSQLLLHKEGGRKTTTSARLPTPKQIHKEEQECVPTNPPSNRQAGRMHPIHKVQHKMGV